MARPLNRRSAFKLMAGTAGAAMTSLPVSASPPPPPNPSPLIFHSELDASAAFGYGGQSYGDPVIEARSEVPTTLRFRNRLTGHVFPRDIDTSLHGVPSSDRVNPRSVLHLHGGVTPPQFDGHPQATILPGQDFVHAFPNRQETAGLWYHDHAMGLTGLNVQAGLASMYLIRDRWDTGLADNPLGLPAGEFEVPLLLQEKIFTADGAQSMRSTPVVPEGKWEGGAVGDVGVKGNAWPEMEVARGLYRFRLTNAAPFSVWNLHFSNRMRFWVVGNDGGLLDAPVATTSVRVAPPNASICWWTSTCSIPGTPCGSATTNPFPARPRSSERSRCRTSAGSGPPRRPEIVARYRRPSGAERASHLGFRRCRCPNGCGT